MPWLFYGDDARDIFNGKKNGYNPFNYIKQPVVFQIDGTYALQHYDHNAQQNKYQEDNVEKPSHRRIGFVDYFVKPVAPGFFIGWFQDSFFE